MDQKLLLLLSVFVLLALNNHMTYGKSVSSTDELIHGNDRLHKRGADHEKDNVNSKNIENSEEEEDEDEIEENVNEEIDSENIKEDSEEESEEDSDEESEEKSNKKQMKKRLKACKNKCKVLDDKKEKKQCKRACRQNHKCIRHEHKVNQDEYQNENATKCSHRHPHKHCRKDNSNNHHKHDNKCSCKNGSNDKSSARFEESHMNIRLKLDSVTCNSNFSTSELAVSVAELIRNTLRALENTNSSVNIHIHTIDSMKHQNNETQTESIAVFTETVEQIPILSKIFNESVPENLTVMTIEKEITKTNEFEMADLNLDDFAIENQPDYQEIEVAEAE